MELGYPTPHPVPCVLEEQNLQVLLKLWIYMVNFQGKLAFTVIFCRNKPRKALASIRNLPRL